MAEDYKKIAESIRSGKYLTDARGWFEAVYIGPVSERSFFLIIAVLAGLIALFGFMAIARLMPITSHDPILIRAGDRADDVQASLIQLAPNHIAINPAMTEFFLTRYVQMRESFDSRTFMSNAHFVQAQSDVGAYNAYVTADNPTNAQSPFANLGDLGQRLVTVNAVTPVVVKAAAGQAPLPAGQGTADVDFSTETRGVSNPDTSQWTARIDYIYTGLETKTVKNPDTGKPELEVTDPHFQVVNYVLSQQAAK